MSIQSTQLADAAQLLHDAQRSGIPISPLTQTYPNLDVAQANSVQRLNLARYLGSGAVLRGHKIGPTSAPPPRSRSAPASVLSPRSGSPTSPPPSPANDSDKHLAPRSRPRTRRRRRPTADRRPRRRHHHPHPRAAHPRRPPERHRSHRRHTHHQAHRASHRRKDKRLIGPTQSPRRHRVSRTRTFPSCLRCRDSRPTDVTFRDHNQPAHSADAAAVEHSVFRYRMGLRESRFGARPLAKLVGDIQTLKRPMAAGAVPVSLLVGSEPEKRD